MSLVATLATNHALQDLTYFLQSLMLWPEPPTVYLYADSLVKNSLKSIKYSGKLVVKEALNPYSDRTRAQMEKIPGTNSGKSLWYEFQMEKLALLDWVFDSEAAHTGGVHYLDSDIFFLSSLPVVPAGYDVAISPHEIRQRDEALYGKYNAGYVWLRTKDAVQAWRDACATSRFFEQAALEVFDSEPWSTRAYHFPLQENYGWWRMFQGKKGVAELQGEWTIFRSPSHSGILVGGSPLRSVHTHWITTDFTTGTFNAFVITLLKKLAPSHIPARKILVALSKR